MVVKKLDDWAHQQVSELTAQELYKVLEALPPMFQREYCKMCREDFGLRKAPPSLGPPATVEEGD